MTWYDFDYLIDVIQMKYMLGAMQKWTKNRMNHPSSGPRYANDLKLTWAMGTHS